MKKIFFLLFITPLLFFSCGPEGSPEVKKAWDEMMVVHDEVMPEMSTIKRLQKKLRKLPQDSTQLEMITELKKAGDAMMTWMYELTPRSEVFAMPEAEALEYLNQETTKIKEVKRLMEESIVKGKKMTPEDA